MDDILFCFIPFMLNLTPLSFHYIGWLVKNGIPRSWIIKIPRYIRVEQNPERIIIQPGFWTLLIFNNIPYIIISCMPFIIDIIGYHFYQWFIIEYWITIRLSFIPFIHHYQHRCMQNSFVIPSYHCYNWLLVSTPPKNISQLGWLFPIYGKIKDVPNHKRDGIKLIFQINWIIRGPAIILPISFHQLYRGQLFCTARYIMLKTMVWNPWV